MTSKNCHERDLLFEEVFFTFSLLLLRLLSLDRDLGTPVLMMNKENTIFDWLNVLRYHHRNKQIFISLHIIWSIFSWDWIQYHVPELMPNCQQLRFHLSLRFLSLLLDLDRFFLSSPILLKSHKTKCHSEKNQQKVVASEAKTMRRAVVRQQQRGPGTKLPQYFHWREDELETWELSTFWQCKIMHY